MRLVPRSFLWRTILMILIPLIIAQVIIANVFFGNHWARVHATLARSLSGEIVTMMNLMDNGEKSAVQSKAIVLIFVHKYMDSMKMPRRA